MSTIASLTEINRQVAERVNKEALANPSSEYANKFVGIANGKIVAVAEDLDTLVCELRQIELDPQKTFCIETGIDYDQPSEIWSLV